MHFISKKAPKWKTFFIKMCKLDSLSEFDIAICKQKFVKLSKNKIAIANFNNLLTVNRYFEKCLKSLLVKIQRQLLPSKTQFLKAIDIFAANKNF